MEVIDVHCSEHTQRIQVRGRHGLVTIPLDLLEHVTRPLLAHVSGSPAVMKNIAPDELEEILRQVGPEGGGCSFGRRESHIAGQGVQLLSDAKYGCVITAQSFARDLAMWAGGHTAFLVSKAVTIAIQLTEVVSSRGGYENIPSPIRHAFAASVVMFVLVWIWLVSRQVQRTLAADPGDFPKPPTRQTQLCLMVLEMTACPASVRDITLRMHFRKPVQPYAAFKHRDGWRGSLTGWAAKEMCEVDDSRHMETQMVWTLILDPLLVVWNVYARSQLDAVTVSLVFSSALGSVSLLLNSHRMWQYWRARARLLKWLVKQRQSMIPRTRAAALKMLAKDYGEDLSKDEQEFLRGHWQGGSQGNRQVGLSGQEMFDAWPDFE